MVHGHLRRLSQLLAAAILAVGFAVVMVGCGPKDKNNHPNSTATKQEMQKKMQEMMKTKGGGKGQ